MENCQLILKITVNLPHYCGVRIPQTPFVEPLGRIHVAGRRQGCGHRGQRLGAGAVVGRVERQQLDGGPTMAAQWRQSNGGNGDAICGWRRQRQCVAVAVTKGGETAMARSRCCCV